MQTDSGSTPFLFVVVRKGLSFTPTLKLFALTRWDLFPTVSFTFRSPFGDRVRPRLAAPPRDCQEKDPQADAPGSMPLYVVAGAETPSTFRGRLFDLFC